MKKIRFMDVSFRDGFQSVLGARVKTADFLPALEAAAEAGTDSFEIGGGARFQSLYFYCQEDAFEMMDACRKTVGPDVNLQTLARGANVVGLESQCREIINLHARMFANHGVSTIRNFDALNDVRNLDYSGRCIEKAGLNHQVVITMMGLPPGLEAAHAHSAEFYVDRLKQVLDAGIPYQSICFKDASGTSTPKTVHDTVKSARKLVGDDTKLEFHTHCTAGCAVSCHMAAIEAGIDIIDLAMAPVSGGTSHPDILTMWHRLRGTEYTLDIDYEKYLTAERIFCDQLEKYFMPLESKEISPQITLSPMPGGALTANTQMMRDNDCLELYPKVIQAMREVVEKGGFGTSVTPVSQFYFQQAFANVTRGKWKTITEGYGRMLLGYYGKTPVDPDPELVSMASRQLGLEKTEESPVDINDRNPELGIAPARAKLEEAGLPVTDENVFIVATCEEKGLLYLQGEAPDRIRYKTDKDEEKPQSASAEDESSAAETRGPASYMVTVDGKEYEVEVAPAEKGATPDVRKIEPVRDVEKASVEDEEVTAPMPGTVLRISAEPGGSVRKGDLLLVLEAMKMEVEVKAPRAGTVRRLDVDAGDNVDSGQVMLLLG